MGNEIKDGPGAEIDELATRVIGAAIEVHRTLGPGFFEKLYEEAMCIEFGLRGIPFRRQVVIGVNYKGHPIGEDRLDLLVDEKLIVELKVVEALSRAHTAQLLSYLKATGVRLGLLMNFNEETLKEGLKRVVL